MDGQWGGGNRCLGPRQPRQNMRLDLKTHPKGRNRKHPENELSNSQTKRKPKKNESPPQSNFGIRHEIFTDPYSVRFEASPNQDAPECSCLAPNTKILTSRTEAIFLCCCAQIRANSRKFPHQPFVQLRKRASVQADIGVFANLYK